MMMMSAFITSKRQLSILDVESVYSNSAGFKVLALRAGSPGLTAEQANLPMHTKTWKEEDTIL